MRTKLISLIVVCALLGAAGAIVAARPDLLGLGSKQTHTTGTALIGGPFTLTNHKGKQVSDTDLRGRLMLIYFGYTLCPDVCPLSLQLMAEGIDALGADGKDVQPMFISVDPERDTAEVMSDYVPHFHKRLLGLTGSPEEIKPVLKAYRVYVSKQEETEPGEYLVNHSSIFYLMGRDGKFIAHFADQVKPAALAAAIRKHL